MEDQAQSVPAVSEDKVLLQETMKQKTVETIKYPGIQLVSKFARFIGILLFITYFVLAIFGVIGIEGFLSKMFHFLQYVGTGFIFLVLGFMIGDVLQVLVDIEKNTRK